MGPKITFVGGGSTHWTPKLLVDFANTESLHDARVTLTDVAPASLPPMLEVGEHIAAVRNIGLSVGATTDLREGLTGSEVVVVTISVGGFESMRHDLEIPARYGIRQPVGDSVGPGGIARALRTIPVVVSIARAMEEVCPDALLVNVSNPLTAICRAVTASTGIRTVGLCNEIVGLKFSMSLLFDVGMHKVDPTVAGVNHLPLVTDLRIGGDDGFAMLRDLMEDPGARTGEPIWMAPPEEAHWRKLSEGPEWTKGDVLANNALKLELLSRFGVLPGASDTHVAEFYPGFVTPASDFGRDWGVHHYGLAGHRADKADDDAGARSLVESPEVSPWPSGELVADLLDGVVGGGRHVLPMNLPNAGQVSNLGSGAVVECMGVAEAGGVRPRDRAGVGSVLGELLRRVNASQELTVEAALTGDRTRVLEAVLTDQLAAGLPYEDVVAMTGELLAATGPWLPQFASRHDEHGAR